MFGEWAIDEPKTLKVCTWNVLADACCNDDDQGFPYTSKKARDTEHRARLQLLEIGGWDADVIALQEVDQPRRFQTFLEDIGYEVFYKRRVGSPLGIMIAFKKSIGVRSLDFHQLPNGRCVALAGILWDNVPITIAAAHLKAKSDAASMHRRLEEVKIILRELMHDANCIFLGDFNDVPGSICCQEVEDSGFTSTHPDDKSELFTTYKTRNIDGSATPTKRAIDHIWYKGLDLRQRAGLVHPRAEDIPEPGLPSEAYPSDHLSVGCQFGIKEI